MNVNITRKILVKLQGGYRFKGFEGAASAALKDLAVPENAVLPLSVEDLTFEAMVEKDDPVRAGAPVAKTSGDCPVWLYAPVNGHVSEIADDKIVFSGDGTTQFEPLKDHIRSPWQLERGELFRQLCASGSILLLSPGHTALEDCDTVNHVIVNAVHTTPLGQGWKSDIGGDPFHLTNGLKILKAVFPETSITIAANKRNARELSSSEIREYASVKFLSDKYPQEDPELLSRAVAGEKLTSPEGVRDKSILVTDFDDLVQVAEIMTSGKPLIDRVVRIAGPGVSRPGWYRARIGTGIGQIRHELMKSDEFGPWRIVRGDIMRGACVEDSDVLFPLDNAIAVIREIEARELFRFMMPGFSWDSYTLTSVAEFVPFLPKKLDSGAHGGERPCVQCNFCDEVCPVGIYPFLIWKHVGIGKIEDSFRLKPYDCIGCGLCDYVCPSKIHVSAAVKKAADEYRKSRRPDADAD